MNNNEDSVQKKESKLAFDSDLFTLGVHMAIYHIERGTFDFVSFAKIMISDLGDNIRPYLKAIYIGIRELPEMQRRGYYSKMSSYKYVHSFDVYHSDKLIRSLFKKEDFNNQKQNENLNTKSGLHLKYEEKSQIPKRKEYKDWKTIPLGEGEEDNNRTRMERWEKANGIKLKSLSEDEWLDVVAPLCAMTRYEAEEWLAYLRTWNGI